MERNACFNKRIAPLRKKYDELERLGSECERAAQESSLQEQYVLLRDRMLNYLTEAEDTSFELANLSPKPLQARPLRPEDVE